MNDQAPVEDSNTSTQTLAIDGITFTAPAPYNEGHQITQREATALNQLFAENLRNNFRKKVADAKEKALAAGAEAITGEALDALVAEFTTYADEYEFAGKRGSRTPTDPVAKEATKIARDKLNEAFKAKNFDKKTLAEGQFDKMVQDLLAKRPDFTELARRRVEEMQALAADILA